MSHASRSRRSSDPAAASRNRVAAPDHAAHPAAGAAGMPAHDARDDAREDALALARAAALTTATGQLTWALDAAGRAADGLPAWRAFTGLSAAAVRGDGWQRALHPDDRACLAAIWSAGAAEAAPHPLTLRVRQASGEYRALAVRILPVAPAGAAVREWLCCAALTPFTPLTAPKPAPTGPLPRESLIDEPIQRGLLDAILEALPEGLALFDRDGALLRVNRTGRATSGTPPSGLTVEGFPAFYEPRTPAGEPIPAAALPLERARRGEPAREIEMLVRRPHLPDATDATDATDGQDRDDGQDVHLVVSAAPIADEQGQVRGFVSVARDVTALRRAQAVTQAQAAELRAVLDSIGDAILVYDAAGRIVRANLAARARFSLAEHPEYAAGSLAERAAALDVRDAAGQPYPQEQWGLPAMLAGKVIRPDDAPDMRVRLPGGSAATFAVSGAPIRDDAGRVIGAVSVLREVSDRRRAEREAAERSREIEAMFDTLTDAAFLYDATGDLRRINQSAIRMLGVQARPNHFDQPLIERSRQFVVRDEHGQPLPPEQWPQSRILRGERLEGLSAMDTIVRTLDGRDLRLNTTGAPLRDERGEIVGAVMIARDVSESRALEQRTHQALDALLAMAEALVVSPSPPPRPQRDPRDRLFAPAGGEDDEQEDEDADEGDPLGLPTRATARRLVELTCRVLGCARASLSVLDLATGFSRPLAVAGLTPEQEREWRRASAHARPEDYLDQQQIAALLAGRPVVMEFSRARAHGQPTYDAQRTLIVPMRVNGQVIGNITVGYGTEAHHYSSGEIALGEAVGHLCSLVVERERLLRDRAASEARAWALEVTQRRMDEFLGVVSHELRTPLTSIKANIQVARRRLHSALFNGEVAATEQTRTLPDLLVRAERQVGRLDTLVNDLLDVSRIQSGKLQLRPAAHNLLDIVTEAVQDERVAWPGRAIVLVDPERAAWPVHADADRIRQVVTNYLTNALKYAPRDQPITVSVTSEPGGAAARVAVRDHGPGVPEAERDAIWDLFHQVPSTQHLNGSGVGLGLGLHICKTIVGRHGGLVGVEGAPGAPGEGATFWFTLPLTPEGDAGS